MHAQDGLTSAEAQQLLERFGPNKLPEKPPPSVFIILFRQLQSPLVYVLLAAGAVTVLLQDYSDAAMIFGAVAINTVLGFIQEKRANDALYALKKMINPTTEVVRDGKRMSILVEHIVPGDIVFLDQGDKVPADGELVQANRLFIQEAMLTGESAAVPKKHGERAYMGTIITGGKGLLKVTLTGKDTEIGKIAESIQTQEEETPMKAQLRRFSKQLSFLVILLTLCVFGIGLLSGRDSSELFTTSVALAVSAIPEGLLVGLTVVLAIGMQRILKQKGLVRNLVSAETLGGVTTICVDKTGTLTQGEMKVVEVSGNIRDLAMQAVLANDMDDPVVLAAYDWGSKKVTDEIHTLVDTYNRIDSLPFSSEERFSASLHAWSQKEHMLFINGAPEYLFEWCVMSQKQKQEITQVIENFTQRGMRLIGFARKKVHASHQRIKKADAKANLEWVGILALSDPIRKGVKEALQETQHAGIQVITITGDYAQTARAVMHELGMQVNDDEIVLGVDLSKLSDAQLAAKLKQRQVKLFARTTPDQKLKIVNALKQNGEVIAMMGDGVNDAPALAKADIGIVVGEATDVAKESADLILLDSKFNTIVSAIEEGRGIFENIRKIILYLMCDAFGAIAIVTASIVFGFPIAITAAQILWVNLVADGLPNLALTVDPKQRHIMAMKPRSPQEPIVNRPMKNMIALVSLVGGAVAFGLFVQVLNNHNIEVARSVAFASLGINTLIYVFSIRTLSRPVWKESPFNNVWLLFAVGVGLLLQVVPFINTSVGTFLGIVPISLSMWAAVFMGAILMFAIIEMSKVQIFKAKR